MQQISIRLPEIDNRVFIKDFFGFIVVAALIMSIAMGFFIGLSTDQNTVLTFEQAIFVIISAVMFVFNETLISYSTISKIGNKLKALEKKEVKDIVFSKIGKPEKDILPLYDEYLTLLKERLEKFKENIEFFKKRSYVLYTIFAMSGFAAVILVLLSFGEVYNLLHFNIITSLENFHAIKIFIIRVAILIQLFLVPCWVISAFQSELVKSALLLFFEDNAKIVKDFNKYLEEVEDKRINAAVGKEVDE